MLVERGVDAVITQGYEAGGHTGWFLPRNGGEVAGTMALVPRVADAVDVPVIAAGGIAAAFALGPPMCKSAPRFWRRRKMQSAIFTRRP